MNAKFRIAEVRDIPQIQKVRNSVKENVLSNPSAITNKDCKNYLTERGRGWVCEINNQIVGFSIVDLIANNVWALFVDPNFENKGIGSKLHELMIDWYFNQKKHHIWLGTDPNTRAEGFYRKLGWKKTGMRENGELKFEMTARERKEFRNKRS